jgi:hypothetical protein
MDLHFKDYNIMKASVQSNSINLKCRKIIGIIDSIINKEPVPINNYSNILIYKKMDTKCIKCNDLAEYLSDDKMYCWKHSQYISYQ